jgi:hypothetical protein
VLRAVIDQNVRKVFSGRHALKGGTYRPGNDASLYSWKMKFGLRSPGCLFLLAAALCQAQTSATDRPLPNISTMMHQVEEHQKASEALVKDYLYHSFATEQSEDGHGGVKKTETEDVDIFYVAGVRIERLIKKNGSDLTP